MSAAQQVQVRWSDLDRLGHVHHATVLTYLEVGRDAVLAAHGIGNDSYVVRHCEVDYRGELRPAGPHVDYVCDEVSLGTTSVRLTERLLDDSGAAAVSATFTLVLWDPQRRRSRSVSDHERAQLSPLTKEHR